VVQAPEWVIENQRIQAKIDANPNLKKKLVKKKPPPRAISWDEKRFRKLLASPPEPLEPQCQVTHGMLINLLQSDPDIRGGGYRRLVELINRSHVSERDKKFQRRRAAMLFRTLVSAGIVELTKTGKHTVMVKVQGDLQKDFSLNHTLSLYLVETLDLLDPHSPELALDMLSLVEAILENPRLILYRQVDKIKGELVARLKAEGVEYAERMEQLDKVEHPKPRAEFAYETFNAFSQVHPWVAGENIRPKSIAREMVENLYSFNDYVNLYGLARAEGVLLRYLSQAYKTAVQNVPEARRTEEFEDILAFLFDTIRTTDSSLLEEWQLLVSGPATPKTVDKDGEEQPRSIDADPRAFAARVRTELHMLLGCLARKDYSGACARVLQTEENPWTPERFETEMSAFYEDHTGIDFTPRARLAGNSILNRESPRVWSARQRILDPEGEDDWTVYGRVDLDAPREESDPLIELDRIGL
jgi:hypothetical protein